MTITELSEKDMAASLAFVLPYERFCISLTAKLRARQAPAFAVRDRRGALQGVFTFSNAGQLFHCLPLHTEADCAPLIQAFAAFLAARRNHVLFSVNGECHGTELVLAAILSVMHRAPVRSQRYDFMRATSAAHAGTATVCKIVRCTPSMAKALFPLQSAYEKEEVVFNLATYNEQVSLLALKKALEEQAIYALYTADGALVAKGGTNAQGTNYVQLGGVYTVPAARKKGYASALIVRIVRDFAAQGKQVALFVKPHNVGAQRLYARCGFEKYGVYEAAYF